MGCGSGKGMIPKILKTWERRVLGISNLHISEHLILSFSELPDSAGESSLFRTKVTGSLLSLFFSLEKNCHKSSLLPWNFKEIPWNGVNCASSKDTPSCTRRWPDFVTAFMTDLRNFYLAGPAVTVSWLLWIFQHATLACCIKNNLPRLYRIHRTTGVQS